LLICWLFGATGQGQLHGNFAATPRQTGNDRQDWSRFEVNPRNKEEHRMLDDS